MATKEYKYALVCSSYPDRKEIKIEEVANLGLESDEIKVGAEIPYEGGEVLKILQLGKFLYHLISAPDAKALVH